jgi:formylglycine-generating enzyme required for sulfatase activity
MSVIAFTNKKTPAIGWAELLRFSAFEKDPGERARAAQLLGLPALPPGFFDDPVKDVGESGKQVAGHEKTIQVSRKALQAPAFWMAEQTSEPLEPEQVLSKTATIPWASNDAHEVESWLSPSAEDPPAAPVLWGNNDPIYRRLKSALRTLGTSVELDTGRLMKRMSAAQWPWPLPVRRTRRLGGRLVIVLDWAEHLRVFERDVAAMAQECEHRFRDVTVDTDVWIGGPNGYLGSTEASLTDVYWGPDVLLVLVSDTGGERMNLKRAWRHWVQRIENRVGGVLVVNPCQSRPAPLDHPPVTQQLGTLLATLSPAITVEPDLVRRMRLALFPGSSALVESIVWTHGDLAGELPARKWRREASNKHLDLLRHLSPTLRARSARVLLEQHANHRKVQRDEEIVRLSTVWDSSVDAVAEVEHLSAPNFSVAMDGVGRVAQHLSYLSKGRANGLLYSRLQASVAAQVRLGRLPVGMLNQRPDWLGWLTEAASENGREAILPNGVQQVWSSSETPAITTDFSLYQQGMRLVLQQDTPFEPEQHSLQPPVADADLKRIDFDSPKVRLQSFEVVGDRVAIHVGGQAVVRMVADLKKPYAITTRLDTGPWARASAQSVRVVWRGGGVTAKWVRRPFGITAWRQDDQGVFATLPVLAGETLEVQLNLDGTCEPIEFQPPIEGDPRASTGAVLAGVGIDADGVYCTAEVWGPNAHNMSTLRLRYIPPGTFLMGSPDNIGHDDEHPQHPVTLSEGFWMAEVPCTQALWQAVMGNNPSHFKEGADAPQRPVESVSVGDVTAFLKKFQTLLPKGVVADLPTEAEWEYACRAGTQTAYWWGDDFDPARTNVDHTGNKDWNAKEGTTPVNRYPPNPWGLYDMHGNVWEWCADDQRNYTAEAAVNPKGSVDTEARVVRGGSWIDHPDCARSAYRFGWHDGFRYRARSQGFRFLLRSSSPGPEGPA